MCGIAALVSNQFPPNEVTLLRMLSRIAHRGEPRFQNEIYVEKNVVLGCNRLAFTSGDEPQPAISPSGRYVVLLNGEIYDFHAQLDEDQVVSDTSKLAEYLDASGMGELETLDGMFALIILDRDEQTVYAVRDRLGIKPLYISVCSNCVLMASEMKALSDLQEVNSYTHIEPGEIVSINLADLVVKKRKYVNIHQERYNPNPDIKHEIICDLRQALINSVRAQTVDQNAYGLFLSGGIDSGALYCILKSLNRVVIPIIIAGAEASDLAYARKLCEEYDDDLIIVPCPTEKTLLNLAHHIVRQVESYEPNIIRQSAVSFYLSLGASVSGLKAIICGEGADELFGGYPEMVGKDFNNTRKRFLDDLHRTQLQRVDRTSMSFTTEVRVPYICNDIIAGVLTEEAVTLHNSLLSQSPETSKPLLREVLRGVVPEFIRNREKVVLSEGAGLGGNDPISGMFAEIFRSQSFEGLLETVRTRHPDWPIRSTEEAYYFQFFAALGYHKYEYSKTRVFANGTNTM